MNSFKNIPLHINKYFHKQNKFSADLFHIWLKGRSASALVCCCYIFILQKCLEPLIPSG